MVGGQVSWFGDGERREVVDGKVENGGSFILSPSGIWWIILVVNGVADETVWWLPSEVRLSVVQSMALHTSSRSG